MNDALKKSMNDAIELGLINSREHVSEARDLISKGNYANNHDAVSAATSALSNGKLAEAQYRNASDMFLSSSEIGEQEAREIQRHMASGFDHLRKCESGLKHALKSLDI